MIGKRFRERVPTRVRGLLLLIPGLALAWWQIWIPLRALEDGRESVTIWRTGVFLAIILPLFGAAMLIIGKPFENALGALSGNGGQFTWKTWVAGGIIGLLAIGAYIFIDIRLDQMGYRAE